VFVPFTADTVGVFDTGDSSIAYSVSDGVPQAQSCPALQHTPHTLHPTPYTLRPTPYTLHPTPYTLNPAPYTLYPMPQAITTLLSSTLLEHLG